MHLVMGSVHTAGLKVSDGQTRDPPPRCERVWLCDTVDLDVDEAWGDDAVLAVQLDVSRALLVKEEFLRVEDLPFSHPQVLPEGTVTHTPNSSAICGGAHGSRWPWPQGQGWPQAEQTPLAPSAMGSPMSTRAKLLFQQ